MSKHREQLGGAIDDQLDRGSRKGGRGILDRLEPTTVTAQRHTTKPLDGLARQVLINYIKPDPKQPRQTIDQATLQELADSIKEHGVLQPITVQSDGDEGYYIITGERRWRASQLAGLEAIPAIIRPDSVDESQKAQQQLVENLQRENLKPIEEARAIQALMDTFKLSQRQAAKKLGKPLTYVAELLQILRVPDELLETGSGLSKHVLIEISRAPASEQPGLLEHALSATSPLSDVKKKRTNRKPQTRTVYYSESFAVEGFPTVKIQYRKHPDEVAPHELAELLGHVVRQLISKAK